MRFFALAVVLLLASCGDGGADDAAGAACTPVEGGAPCCRQEPLTQADCPEGYTLELYESADPTLDFQGAVCIAGESDVAKRLEILNGATIQQAEREDDGTTLLTQCRANGYATAELRGDGAQSCWIACYDSAGAKVGRAACEVDVAPNLPDCD